MVIFIVSLFSALTQTVTGFGYGIIMMAILPFLIPLDQALVLSTMSSMVLNALIFSRFLKHIKFKLMAIPVLFATLGSLSGLLLLSSRPSPIYKQILGVFLCVLAVWFIFFSSKIKIRPTTLNASAVGIVSGVCGGLFSISGPPAIAYFVSVFEDIRDYMGTTQFYFFVNNLVILAVRFSLNMVPAGIWSSAAFSLAGLLCGSAIGNMIFKKVEPGKIKQAVYILMAVSGVYTAFGG